MQRQVSVMWQAGHKETTGLGVRSGSQCKRKRAAGGAARSLSCGRFQAALTFLRAPSLKAPWLKNWRISLAGRALLKR